MSTTISNIYDELYLLLPALFPSKKALADSYNIYNNDEFFLADGFGIYVGPASNTRREVACRLSISRQITITLSKAPYAGHKDLDKIKIAEKALLEEHLTLVKDFSKNNTYPYLTSVKRNFIGDSGIERVFGESRSYLSIRLTFEIEYFENLQ